MRPRRGSTRVLATLYGDRRRYRARVQALHGDLTLGVRPPDAPVDVVCHCAASISFDLPLEEAREINVEGTRAMLALARAAGARRFVHVSTAYVAGTHAGRFTRGHARHGVPQHLRADEVRGGAASSAPSSDMEVAIARPEHRHGRVRHGLDAGVQRPLLAAARVRPRPVRAGAGAARGARRRRARSTTSPTASPS